MKEIQFESVGYKIVPFDDNICNSLRKDFDREPSIFEMTNLIADFPLKYQIILMVNLLTISGFSEKEIAESLNMPYLKYRQLLSRARKEFQNKKVKEL